MGNNSLWLILYRLRTPLITLILSYAIAIIGLTSIEGMDDSGNAYYMSIFDAFYFLSYTATTIGFGEVPYEFTYGQRLWVIISIYMTVLAWAYCIGSIISMIQDKVFLQELAKGRFKKQVRSIREDFLIVLGFTNVTKEVIKQALKKDLRIIVIEKNENRVAALNLEGFIPYVPILKADAHDPKALEYAGIKSKYCKGLISLFQDDYLNLRIAITAKMLNPKAQLAIKSTTPNQSENLKDVGVEIVENPFEIIAGQIDKAINASSLLKIERWLYKTGSLDMDYHPFPRGKYIVCGYGRMGKAIREVLEKNGINASYIEIDNDKAVSLSTQEKEDVVIANSDDRQVLTEAGIQKAVAIIIGTNNDTTNLSILATAKKLNNKIITIVRENEMEDFSIFQNTHIDYIFMPSRLLITKTTNAMIRPLIDRFSKSLSDKDEQWGQKLIKKLMTISTRPHVVGLRINDEEAQQITAQLKAKKTVHLATLLKSRQNKEHHNAIFALMIKRDHSEIILPKQDIELMLGDAILFACSSDAKSDMQYIAQNYYEFHYVTANEYL
ncbi:MAG: potassium channel family protein [Campylobacterota bacterium]